MKLLTLSFAVALTLTFVGCADDSHSTTTTTTSTEQSSMMQPASGTSTQTTVEQH